MPPDIFARVSFQGSLSAEISQEWIPGDLRAHFPQEWILKGLRERTCASPPNLRDAIAAQANMGEGTDLLRRNGCARCGGLPWVPHHRLRFQESGGLHRPPRRTKTGPGHTRRAPQHRPGHARRASYFMFSTKQCQRLRVLRVFSRSASLVRRLNNPGRRLRQNSAHAHL